MTIVERIKSVATARGETLTSLERAIGLSKSSIRKWDIQSPSIDKVIKISEYLQVSIDYLATGKISGLSEEEREFLTKWNNLDKTEQEVIQGQIDTILEVKKKKNSKLSS